MYAIRSYYVVSEGGYQAAGVDLTHARYCLGEQVEEDQGPLQGVFAEGVGPVAEIV